MPIPPPSPITETADWTTPVYRPVDGQYVTGDSVGDPLTQLVERSVYIKDKIEGSGIETPFEIVTTLAAMKALTGMVDNQIVLYVPSGIYPNSLWKFSLGVTLGSGYYYEEADDSSGTWIKIGGNVEQATHGPTITTTYDGLLSRSYAGRSLCPNYGAQTAKGIVASSGNVALNTSYTLIRTVNFPFSFTNQVVSGDIINARFPLGLTATYLGGSPARLTADIKIDLQTVTPIILASYSFSVSMEISSTWASPPYSMNLNPELVFSTVAAYSNLYALLYAKYTVVSGGFLLDANATGIIEGSRP
jgi:hypothetical protein